MQFGDERHGALRCLTLAADEVALPFCHALRLICWAVTDGQTISVVHDMPYASHPILHIIRSILYHHALLCGRSTQGKKIDGY